ncbi:zinc ribbon domain-containing protein [Oxynema aestuarii]|uniref:Helix-turn-helix domain-containing protein n=1 Tax=Oxynema aestuarii AP17 TaxID=2064643 RepID=A0A6H1TYX9_9CYAN|nr:helix-turn-helix domain-containing protein [Oxynema aestuarii]QIZ70569.1 helix-turn-helix domain-containing protein [Oxynema aestuarii AP17]
MLRATRVRIYPTAKQRQHLAQSFGCCRFAWNYALNLTNETYKATGKGLSRFAIQKEITNLKKEYEWMKEPYSQCLQVVALNLSPGGISQVGWGQFCTLLKYKCEWEGKVYYEVDRFFPSSKTCNVCLNQVRSLTLDLRSWQCEKCGTQHDRDINAAKKIGDEGVRIISSGTGEIADRPSVSRDSRGRKTATVSQFDG